MALEQLREAMDSAQARMLSASETYMEAADRFMSDPNAFEDFQKAKVAVSAATQVYQQACDAYFNAAKPATQI
jgi:hypothetical protein